MRVLLVSPSFFGYEKSIAAALERMGAQVDLYDERVANSNVSKALLRVAPSLLGSRTRAHFDSILAAASPDSYDGLIVVKGENTPPEFVQAFREKNPRARAMLYLFDAIANSPRCVDLFPLMDRVYSFDRSDVDQRSDLTYKPLFYDAEYVPQPVRDIDVSFVGTLHSDRYEYCRKVVSELPPATRTALRFYSPAKWYFTLQRLFDSRVRRVRRADVTFAKISRAEVARLFGRSRVVIDSPRDGQVGLTMRTFEALASGAALITTNEAVREEDFFDPARILVVSRVTADIDAAAVAKWVAHASFDGAPEGFVRHSTDEWAREFILDIQGDHRQ